MDSTELMPKTQRLAGSEDVERQAIQRSRLCECATILRRFRGDSEQLARTTLDGLIDGLDGERAFLVRVRAGKAAPGQADVDVLRARHLVAADRDAVKKADLTGAEFSIDHALVKRAAQDLQPIHVREALVEPAAGGREIHRSIVGCPFDLGDAGVWVLYVDRAVGMSPFTEGDLALLEEFTWASLPLLESARLRRKLSDARVAVRESRADADTDADADADADADTDPDAGAADGRELAAVDSTPSFHGIIGRAPRMLKIFELVDKIKDTDFNICVLGESGTGKELLARAIHAAGGRADKEFISENCGALSENLLESELFGYVKGSFTGADETRKGLFELADGGTLFLDEIGDMSEGMQRKLLRVLQEGVIRPIGSKKVTEVDVRVICASNKDLRALVESGSFRADLYYRLNVISIEVPPLRERMDDLPALIQHTVDAITKEEGLRRRLSESAAKALLAYNWPGNIRELQNVLRRVLITGKRRLVTRKEVLALLSGGPARSYVGEGVEEAESQIQLRIPRRGTFNEIIDECEKAVLLNALKENRWNKSRVTKVLKIPRQSLYNKIAKYGLKRSAAPRA